MTNLAANGVDVVALDIVGPVSTASNAVPATPEKLHETNPLNPRLWPARGGHQGARVVVFALQQPPHVKIAKIVVLPANRY
jgi:hypothetical protein